MAAAALAFAACDRPGPGEPEEQPESPADEDTDEVDDVEQKSQAEVKAEFDRRAADNLAASQQFLAENAEREDVKVTDSGLQYMVLEEGPEDGATPVSTDLVVVHYVGTLKDGVEFDSSRARGAAAQFRLNEVIPGWTEGVQLMSEGDRYRFFVPPKLAYGEINRPGSPIGPNEALIFDVELIKVQSPESNLAAANKFLEENAMKEGVKTTGSGLQYLVLSEGPEGGASPDADDMVKVHYQTTLINGTELGSSYPGGEPVDIPVTMDLAGWTEGLQLMSEGDKYRFFLPPKLAYGETGAPGGVVAPNEALIFEVELIEVNEAPNGP